MNSTELELKGKSPLRRVLHLRLSTSGRYMSVSLCSPAFRNELPTTLVWANSELELCWLECFPLAGGTRSIWVASTAFDVSNEEAEQIRALFGPLGLRIQETPAVSPQSIEMAL